MPSQRPAGSRSRWVPAVHLGVMLGGPPLGYFPPCCYHVCRRTAGYPCRCASGITVYVPTATCSDPRAASTHRRAVVALDLRRERLRHGSCRDSGSLSSRVGKPHVRPGLPRRTCGAVLATSVVTAAPWCAFGTRSSYSPRYWSHRLYGIQDWRRQYRFPCDGIHNAGGYVR